MSDFVFSRYWPFPVLSCHIMSFRVLTCSLSFLVWFFPFIPLSFPVLSRPNLSCPVLSNIVMSCQIMHCLCFRPLLYPFLSDFVRTYSCPGHDLSIPVLSFTVLSCSTLSCKIHKLSYLQYPVLYAVLFFHGSYTVIMSCHVVLCSPFFSYSVLSFPIMSFFFSVIIKLYKSSFLSVLNKILLSTENKRWNLFSLCMCNLN